MASVLDSLPQASRIAVIRLRSLGDCVLTTPALHILNRYRPDLRVAVVSDDRFRPVFEGNPAVECILLPRLSALRQWRPNLSLNFHGGTTSAWFTALSGSEHRAGFGHYRYQWIYNARIPRAQQILGVDRTVHTAEHLASAMFWLGAAPCEIPRAELFASRMPAPSPVAVIHAVAATPEKTWRADGFLAAAARLRDLGMDPVFIGAASDDLTPFRQYRALQGAPLAEVKQLLAGAAFFIGNDSGPAHMAAAFGLPVVVIFGDSNPAIWGPWRTPSETVTAPGGIANVEISQVLDALERLRVHA